MLQLNDFIPLLHLAKGHIVTVVLAPSAWLIRLCSKRMSATGQCRKARCSQEHVIFTRHIQ